MSTSHPVSKPHVCPRCLDPIYGRYELNADGTPTHPKCLSPDEREVLTNDCAAGRWRVGRVYRSDCGAPLYAPVDSDGTEHGHTPSCDADAMQRLCDQLNSGALT